MDNRVGRGNGHMEFGRKPIGLTRKEKDLELTQIRQIGLSHLVHNTSTANPAM